MDTVTRLLVDQLDFYLEAHLLPRLEGLGDEEFAWEPVPGCWSLVEGTGGWVVEHSWPKPEPEPPPVTTIGWRLGHIAASNLGTRAHAFFGPAAGEGDTFNDPCFTPAIPAGADGCVGLLREMWQLWRAGLLGLGDAGLLAPIGAFGGPFADSPMATLVTHVSRETMHHGGEIGVLRDLYREGYPQGG